MSKTHSFKIDKYVTTYGQPSPALCVASGDTVIVQTRDAWGFNENNKPMPDRDWATGTQPDVQRVNPLVGPICVEGAEPGDTLAVTIKNIALNRSTAWSGHLPHFGAFTGEVPNRRMVFNEPLKEILYDWRLDLQKKTGCLRLKQSRLKKVVIPLHPFIGSIGVAPRFGRVESSLTPGEYGGNMDSPETKKGTTLYLPVSSCGAHLAFGDIHAAQGDGELCGVALETTAKVTVNLKVLKKNIDWPRLEDRTHIMTVGSIRPLEDALRIASLEMVNWLVGEYRFEKWEAWQVISQVAEIRIGNVCDPNYTVVLKYPKCYLPN